jgi:hypothetical protein
MELELIERVVDDRPVSDQHQAFGGDVAETADDIAGQRIGDLDDHARRLARRSAVFDHGTPPAQMENWE